MLNLNGAEGRNEMPSFTAANFAITSNTGAVPEPSSVFLMLPALGACCYLLRRKGRKALLIAENNDPEVNHAAAIR